MKREIRGFIIGVVVMAFLSGTFAFASQGTKIIEAFYDDISIFIYGNEITPTDANGEIVEPFRYNGTTYLPVRAISEALGMPVYWDEAAKNVYLGDLPTEFRRQLLDALIKLYEDEQITEVTVSTVDEFISELGSNKTIYLKPGVYNLSESDVQLEGNVYWEYVYDGGELTFDNIVNLKIIGDENGGTEIITNPRYSEIFNFEACGNITIQNIKAGHTPEEYECDAGVFYFYDSVNIVVDNCYLYGCGATGVTLYDVNGFSCNNTIITDCSLRGAYIHASTDVIFNNTQIIKNRAYASAISVAYESEVEFIDCEISENNNIEWSLFETTEASKLTLTNCIIRNNQNSMEDSPCMFDTYGYGNFESGKIILNNCIIENNKTWVEYGGEKPIYNDSTFKGNVFLTDEE